MDRRTVLASIGVLWTVGIGGCSQLRPGDSTGDLPAGTLQFENRDALPHTIGFSIGDVGTDVETTADGHDVTGETAVPHQQRRMTAASSVAPGETQTFDEIFTEPAYYLVEFTLDGTPPDDTARAVYNPAPDGGYNTLTGRVDSTGSFTWLVSATDDPGPVDD
ncbi:hypothetical protein C479_07241 [Halovivax asiaticus JCM 14624]|uniref:Uncharacterized protein n=1 Tax=Halovivax asiaticus JCM 14624 TaxID=1227490 RepID=M0BPW1_9EURY|nr:hypothetical protein [Halovivax asiaticus]ELZ11639.1 hypothetical protein C479_07241 [Halovivax asiaticus JCM 14624]